MTNKLIQQTVLITGASGGLGEQIAYAAAKEGAKVIVCARSEEKLKKVANKCSKLANVAADYFVLDVSKPEEIATVVAAIFQKHGTIDVLVNNAGFGLFKNFSEFDKNVMEEMFRVNVLGLMTITQAVVKKMQKQQSGHIINVASQAGKMATPKSSVYSATKFAVLGFSNALRLELKESHIKVTTVNPGPIKTNFFDRADETGNYLKTVGLFVLDPAVLSKKIIACIGKNKREINSPYVMQLASVMYSLFPKISDILALKLFNKK